MSLRRSISLMLLLVPLGLGIDAAHAAECNDLLDNDGDGATDLADSDCADAADPYEGVGVLGVQKISDTQGYLSDPGSPGTNPGGLLPNSGGFGVRTAGIGDFDGDGTPDFVVGANLHDDGGSDRGAIYLLLLNADGTVKERHKISSTSGGLPGGTLANFDQFGISPTAIGDLDGDGVTDLAVGALLDDGSGSDRGAVHILFMNADATVKAVQTIDDSDVPELGNGDIFGVGIAWLGHINGTDAPPVLAVGASGHEGAVGSDRGAVYLLWLNPDGSLRFHTRITEKEGGFGGSLDDGDRFGASIAHLGDLDGDGTTEIAVGAAFGEGVGSTNTGSVWILSLRQYGKVASELEIANGTGGLGSVLSSQDIFGDTLAAVGDLDGDGVGDLVVGATGDDTGGSGRGAVYVLFLNPDGSVKTSPAPVKIAHGLNGFPSTALGNDDQFGFASSADVDGDGVPDLLVGAALDDDGGTNRGAAYVVFLDGQPAVCGDGVVDPGEECDDGGNVSGDLCTASCESETWLALEGTASAGGSFEVTVDGNVVVQATSSGQTIAQVLAALAASIEAADPDLEAVVSGDVLYTNGAITNVVDNDFGLMVGPQTKYFLPLDVKISFELPGITSKHLDGFVSLPFGGARLATPLGRLRELDLLQTFTTQTSDATSIGVTNLFTWSISDVGFLTTSLPELSLPQAHPIIGSGSMRICIVFPCPAGAAMPIPLDGLGRSQVDTTTTLVNTVMVSHHPFTFSTALPSSFGPTTPLVGFMHGPLSNSATAGLDGGVIQMVAPSLVSPSSSLGDFGVITRLTITMVPEPSRPLLLASGLSLLVGLHLWRRRREKRR